MSAAIGCLTRQSVDAAHCPYLTPVSDGCNNTGQFNAIHSAAPDSELSHALLAADVTHGLPVTIDSQCIVTAAGQLQVEPVSSMTEDQSMDQLPHLTQYPLSDVSSVLAEQTLVGSRTLCAEFIEVTQYLLSDSSSDGSRRAVEPASLPQFPLDDSPDNTTALHRETDNTAVMDSSISHVKLLESSVQRKSEPVNHCLLTETSAYGTNEANQHGGGCVTSGNTAADTKSIVSELADGQGKHDGDVDLLVSVDTNNSGAASCFLPPTGSVDSSKTLIASNKLMEPDDIDRCLALHTGLSTLLRMEQSGTVADKTDLNSTVSAAVNPQMASYCRGSESISVTDTGTKTSSGAEIIGTVVSSSITVPLPAASSTTQPREEKLLDTVWASLPASVEPGCMHQVNVLSDACETSTAVVAHSKPVTDDREQTSNLQLMETSGTESAKWLRNTADGSKESDILYAVQTTVHVTHSTAADSSRSINDIARCGIVSGRDDIKGQSVLTEQSDAVIQSHGVSADHRMRDSVICDTDRYKAPTFADTEGQLQLLTVTTEKPSDLALPLEQDSGSEFDGDDLAEDVKMILAKYRIRRAPIGSDSMPVASSANVDNVLMPDAIEPLLKDTSTARDLDTCSSSSDDALANRVKALLIKVQSENHTSAEPTTASNVTSESVSRVHSVHSSQSTSVDYNSLSRELDEIQMNLNSMRNSESSSSGSHYISDGSPRIHNQSMDDLARQELLALLLQQKHRLDQLLQHSSVSSLAGDYVEDTVSSIGVQNPQQFYAHKSADGQNVTDGSRDVPDLSTMLDTISEVSSIRTDIHQSDSNSCTQLDDCASARSENTGAEAAVKQLEQHLSNLLQSDSYDISPTSGAYSSRHESELLKHLSSEAAGDWQTSALYNDEHCPNETALSQSYSTACDLSPVPKHSSFNAEKSHHPMSSLHDTAAAVQLTESTELQFSAACNDNYTTQSFNRNVQQTENPGLLRSECDKQKDYKISNKLVPQSADGRLPHVQESYSVSSNKEMLTFGTQFVSAADVLFTPLTQVPREGDSSDNGSYDGDRELPLIGQQSRDGNTEVQSYGEDAVVQQLSLDKTLVDGNNADVSVSCVDADRSAQTVASYSPASVNLLQPYQ